MSASMLVAPASVRPAFSPRGSMGDSLISYSACVPTGCFSSAATLIFTFCLAPWSLADLALLLSGLCASLLYDLAARLDHRGSSHGIAFESRANARGVLVCAVHTT